MIFISFFIVIFAVIFVILNHIKNPSPPIGKYRRLVNLVFVLALITVSLLTSMILSGLKSDTISNNPCYVVVLGSGLIESKVTTSLAERLDQGYEVAVERNIPIVVSGGQGNDEEVSEAQAMLNYLVLKGFEGEILIENQSHSTYSNIRYSKDLIGDCKNIVIATSDYHGFRSKMIAKDLGLEATVVTSKTPIAKLIPKMYRENVALLKDIIFNVFR